MPAALMARRKHRRGGWQDAGRSLWCAAPAISLGWLAGLGFLYAAVKAPRRWDLWAATAAYLALGFGGFALVGGDTTGVGVVVSLTAMIVGTVHAFTVRERWLDEVYGPGRRPNALQERAKRRRELREEVLEQARRDPLRARELGVGRPDLDGAWHAELVDVNHASVEAVASLPAVSEGAAWSIVAARDELDGFESLDDMGTLLDLPPHTVEQLRGRVVFLPR